MAKVTRVTLATVREGARETFSIDHAERILMMRDSGWMLPEDSEYEYKDGIISRRGKKGSK